MITTLAAEWAGEGRAGTRRTSAAFGSSVAIHVIMLALCGLIRMPAGRPGETTRPHYPYRMLQLRTEDFRRLPAPRVKTEAGRHPTPSRAGLASSGAPGAAGGQSPRQEVGTERRTFVLPPPQQAKPVEHTLVQLDVPDIAPRSNVRVPEALIWSHIDAKKPLKQFVAPSPKPLRAAVKALPVVPRLEVPNQQSQIADLKMSVDPLAINPRLALPNATTSPVRVEAKERSTQLPETISAAPNQTSAGNLISVPDLAVRADGLSVAPPANQIAALRNPDGVAGGAGSGKGSQPGTGEGEGKGRAGAANGQGTGPGGTGKDLSANAPGGGAGGSSGGGSTGGGVGAGVSTGSGAGTGSSTGRGAGGPGGGNGPGDQQGNRPEVVRLVRPANGSHSAIVFGASASEPYPESAGVLSGKIIYTVYLQVGLRKNWILQYCLPKAVAAEAAAGGAMTALAAPWPTLIVRPKNSVVADGDYVLVHGMITAAGRFMQLATVVPEQFENKKQLMDALQEWEFRPAARDGQPSAVEVLLIIPSA